MTKDVQEYINTKAVELWNEAKQEINQTAQLYKRLRSCSADVLTKENFYILRSYNTFIACIDKRTDTLIDVLRLVQGYTATSAQHISKFNHDYCAKGWGCDVTYTWRDI